VGKKAAAKEVAPIVRRKIGGWEVTNLIQPKITHNAASPPRPAVRGQDRIGRLGRIFQKGES